MISLNSVLTLASVAATTGIVALATSCPPDADGPAVDAYLNGGPPAQIETALPPADRSVRTVIEPATASATPFPTVGPDRWRQLRAAAVAVPSTARPATGTTTRATGRGPSRTSRASSTPQRRSRSQSYGRARSRIKGIARPQPMILRTRAAERVRQDIRDQKRRRFGLRNARRDRGVDVRSKYRPVSIFERTRAFRDHGSNFEPSKRDRYQALRPRIIR